MNNRLSAPIRAGFAVLVAVNVIGVADALAQQPPPIHGVTGTIATDTSVQETSAAGGKLVGKVKRILHLTGRTTVPSGDAAGEEALGGLKKGTRVVVRHAAVEMSGSVVALNLADRAIVVRLSDDSIQTLRLSDEAAADAQNIDRAGDSGTSVIVYFRNESGQRVAKAFQRVS
jgi:hypothetical protein